MFLQMVLIGDISMYKVVDMASKSLIYSFFGCNMDEHVLKSWMKRV